jgi:hypothetical protein
MNMQNLGATIVGNALALTRCPSPGVPGEGRQLRYPHPSFHFHHALTPCPSAAYGRGETVALTRCPSPVYRRGEL